MKNESLVLAVFALLISSGVPWNKTINQSNLFIKRSIATAAVKETPQEVIVEKDQPSVYKVSEVDQENLKVEIQRYKDAVNNLLKRRLEYISSKSPNKKRPLPENQLVAEGLVAQNEQFKTFFSHDTLEMKKVQKEKDLWLSLKEKFNKIKNYYLAKSKKDKNKPLKSEHIICKPKKVTKNLEEKINRLIKDNQKLMSLLISPLNGQAAKNPFMMTPASFFQSSPGWQNLSNSMGVDPNFAFMLQSLQQMGGLWQQRPNFNLTYAPVYNQYYQGLNSNQWLNHQHSNTAYQLPNSTIHNNQNYSLANNNQTSKASSPYKQITYRWLASDNPYASGLPRANRSNGLVGRYNLTSGLF